MTYLYPIEFKQGNQRKYYFGEADLTETQVARMGTCKTDNCAHNTPTEASDCFRQYLLDNQWKVKGGNIEPRKCCIKKCPNQTTQIACLGEYIQYPLCEEHRNKTTVKKIGWGFVLNLRGNK